METHDNRDNEFNGTYESYGRENTSTQLVPSERQTLPPEPPQKQNKNKRKKPTRKERKELCKQQAQYEKQLIKEGKIAPRYRYVPRNSFARILSVCLAFVFGFFAAFGALIGGFAYFGTQKSLKEVSETAGFDYSAVFTDTAAELSALDLIVEITEKFQNGEMNTLQSFARYTPLVDSVIDATCEQLAETGFDVNKSELMAVPFEEIGAWFRDNVVRAVTLAGFLGVDEDTDDLFLRAICYKETDDGETYAITIDEFMNDSGSVIGDIEIEILLGTDGNSDAALKYLAYGSEYDSSGERRYTVNETDGSVTMIAPNEKKTIDSLTDEDADLIGGARLGDLIDIDESSSKLLQTIRNWTINDLTNQTRIERLKIGQLLDNTENSNLLRALSDWRISDLSDQNKVNSLTLRDVLQIDDEHSAKILVSLQDTRLGEFSDAIETLRLSDILEEEDIQSNKILRNLKDSTVLSLADDLNQLSVKKIFADDMYSYLSLSAMKDKYDALTAAEKAGSVPITTGSYAELVEAYITNKSLNYNLAGIVPEAIELQEGETVVTEYRYGETPVELGYFSGTELVADVYTGTKKTADGSTETYYYTQTETAVTPVFEWSVIDYETGSTAVVENPEDYDADDLDCKIIGYEGYDTLNEMGDIVTDGEMYRVYEKEDGGFYILLRSNATPRYYDPVTLEPVPDGGEVTVRYFLVKDGEKQDELDRYLDGVWFLLFGGEDDYSMDVSILEINKTITKAVTSINDLQLWELYLHGMITVNPFKDFGNGNNLNELTIEGMIAYIQKL